MQRRRPTWICLIAIYIKLDIGGATSEIRLMFVIAIYVLYVSRPNSDFKRGTDRSIKRIESANYGNEISLPTSDIKNN